MFDRKRLKEEIESGRAATMLAAVHNGLMPRKDGHSWSPYQFGMKEPAAFRELRDKVDRIKAERSVTKKQYPKWSEPTEEQQKRTKRRAGGK